MKEHRQKGFTLYELMITVLIVGVVLTIGVPNLSGFTRNSRITSTTNDLHGSFLLARSEAARAKANVTICASADPFGAALCDGASFDKGWIIFVDNIAPIGVRGASNEPVLKVFPPVPETLSINANRTSFSFAATGLGDGGSAFVAMICDERGNTVAAGGNSAARRIVVTPIGRSTILRSQQTIQASIEDPDSPWSGITCTS